MYAAISSGVVETASKPRLTMRSFRSSFASALRISPERRTTNSCGVPAGAAYPIQPAMSYYGSPALSASGGTSGSAAERRAVETPKVFTRPDLMWDAVAATVSMA